MSQDLGQPRSGAGHTQGEEVTDLKGQGSWNHEEQSVGALRSCCPQVW